MSRSTTFFVCVLVILPVSRCVQELKLSRQIGYNVPIPYSPAGYALRQTFQSPTIDAVRDIVLATILGIPLMGLMAVGGMVLLPLFGVNLGAIGLGSMTSATSASATSATSSTSTNTKKKKWKREVSTWTLFGRMLDLMDELEDTLARQEVFDQECKYKTVCEAHVKVATENFTSSLEKQISNTIKELIRQQQELEPLEWFPLSGLLFGPYLEAARQGIEHSSCTEVYPKCRKLELYHHNHLQSVDSINA